MTGAFGQQHQLKHERPGSSPARKDNGSGIGKPPKAKKAVLLLNAGMPKTYEGPITVYRDMISAMGIEDAGVCSVSAADCASEEKLAEIRNFAKGL